MTPEYKVIMLAAKVVRQEEEINRIKNEVDVLEENIIKCGKRQSYTTVKFEGTPYQDTRYFFFNYVESQSIRRAFEKFRDSIDKCDTI